VTYTFVPDPARGVATVLAEPPLAGASVDAQRAAVAGPATTGAAR
jgi:hypothetical protein